MKWIVPAVQMNSVVCLVHFQAPHGASFLLLSVVPSVKAQKRSMQRWIHQKSHKDLALNILALPNCTPFDAIHVAGAETRYITLTFGSH